MNKLILPAILATTMLVAGTFALMPVQKASTIHSGLASGAASIVRDNLVVTDVDITVPDTQAMVLADNAGIGGASDVEVVWKIADADCAVASFDGAVVTNLTDDAALDGIDATLNHRDVANAQAVLLREINAGVAACDLVAGDFITVSTVGT